MVVVVVVVATAGMVRPPFQGWVWWMGVGVGVSEEDPFVSLNKVCRG